MVLCLLNFLSKVNLHVTDVVLNSCTIVMTMTMAGEGGGLGGMFLQLSKVTNHTHKHIDNLAT